MQRNSLHPSSLGRMALPLAIAIVCGTATRGEASIVQPGLAANVDDVLASVEQGAGMSSSTAPAQESRNLPPQGPAEETPSTPFALNQGAPTSGGSTSAPSGPTAGGTMSCVMTAEIVVNSDDASTRLAIGQSIFLPTPPGVDLLRPPQA